jgi:hypothetical protein
LATEKFANNSKTTLVGAITSGATTLAVASASSFPTSGQFRLLIDSELMLVTSVSGTTFTVTRGVEGTSAASHADGSNVYGLFTAGALNQIIADNIASGTQSNRPASEKAGKLYLPTDGYLLSRDNGGSFDVWGPLGQLYDPTAAGLNFSPDGAQHNGSVVTTGNMIYLSTPGSSSDNISFYAKPAPATPYTITALLEPLFDPTDYAAAGLAWSDGTLFATFQFSHDSTGTNASAGVGAALAANKFSNYTTFNSSYKNRTLANFPNRPKWLRIADDGTNRICSWSNDGVNFITFHSVARTDFLTPTKVGIFVDSINNVTVGLTLLSWKQG